VPLEKRQTTINAKITALNLSFFEKVDKHNSYHMCKLTSYVKEMVWTEPTNIRTVGIDTNHVTMFMLLQELNVVCGQRWIQFELQNSLRGAFAIDGKIYTTI